MSNQDGTPNHEAIAAYFEKYPDRVATLAQMAEDSTLAPDAPPRPRLAAARRL